MCETSRNTPKGALFIYYVVLFFLTSSLLSSCYLGRRYSSWSSSSHLVTMNLRMEISTRHVRAERIGDLEKPAQACLLPDLFYLREKQTPILFNYCHLTLLVEANCNCYGDDFLWDEGHSKHLEIFWGGGCTFLLSQ